jgi:hypothetical protein
MKISAVMSIMVALVSLAMTGTLAAAQGPDVKSGQTSVLVPQFDVEKECQFEGGSSALFDQCSKDETAALAQLRTEWTQFTATDKKTCMAETTIDGLASYVELKTCLEMARDAASPNTDLGDRRAKSGPLPGQAGRSGPTTSAEH